MTDHLILVPANQKNVVYGDPNPMAGATYEQHIALIRAQEGYEECLRWKSVVPHLIYVEGVGSYTTDELGVMLDRMMRLIRSFSKGDRAYPLSYHSDASGHQDIYPLVCRDAAFEYLWANRIATRLGKLIGMPTDPARYRPDLGFSRRLDDLPPQRGVLLEIGVHGPTAGPIYGMAGTKALWLFARFHGLMAARAFAFECGLITDAQFNASVPADVAVPPGFEFWHAEPVGEVIPQLTRLIRLTDPYMRGEDVRWAQEQLVEWGYKPLTADAIYGPNTVKAVKAFQASKGLRIDGVIGTATWQALGAV